jgi:hypothetical protein
MSPETLNLLKPIAKIVFWAVFAMDAVGFLTMLLERFGPAKGTIVALAGKAFNIFGETPIGNSLLELRRWHLNPTEVAKPLIEDGRLQQLDVEKRHKFSLWMVHEMVHKYENNVQGFAYLGASVLIVVIGLRGIQVLDKSHSVFIILALALEFTLIGALGLMVFYKPEEDKRTAVDAEAREKNRDLDKQLTKTREDLEKLKDVVKKVTDRIGGDTDTLRKAIS